MIHIIWNNSDTDVEYLIDGLPGTLAPNTLITSTYYNKIKVLNGTQDLVIFSFNREYYCIYDHDSEVSCNGIIFFGAQELIEIHLDEVLQRKFNLLLEVFIDEFKHKDKVQGEMLVVLLKRLIIICTRIAKQQLSLQASPDDEVELIRQFNYLVDMNFREHKSVKEYADMLHRSPKTLSNVFSKNGGKSPLQIIHDRIVLEGRRQLSYTDKTVNEIAFDLGFEEPNSFSRLFKKQMNESPQAFRSAHPA